MQRFPQDSSCEMSVILCFLLMLILKSASLNYSCQTHQQPPCGHIRRTHPIPNLPPLSAAFGRDDHPCLLKELPSPSHKNAHASISFNFSNKCFFLALFWFINLLTCSSSSIQLLNIGITKSSILSIQICSIYTHSWQSLLSHLTTSTRCKLSSWHSSPNFFSELQT